MTYPANNTGGAGEVVSFSYNNQMLLTHSQSASYTYVNDILYDAAGRTQLRQLGTSPNLTTSYVYYDWTTANGAGRLQTIQSGNASPYNAMQQMSYTYSANGNVLTITDYKAGGTQTQTFTYDDLDRLVTAQAAGGSGGTYGVEEYEYDASTGNIASTTPLGDYTYQDTAHKHAVTHLGGVLKYQYDANGNMTTRISGANTYNYTYDQENHLTGVSGSATATFAYDGDGVRVKGTVGGVTTTYIGDYFEWTGSVLTMKKYYYAAGTRIAMRSGGSSSVSWLLGDHLGSQALTVSDNGLTKNGEKRYDAWGEQRYTSGTTPTTFRYTGQRFEESLGIYYYGARWVDPALGRWLSPDTIIPDQYDPQSWDRFAYVRNNPVNRVDPTGHVDDGPGFDFVDNDNTVITYIVDVSSESNSNIFSESDYRSFSFYSGTLGQLLELLIAQLEPTPITELGAGIAGKVLSGGVTISWDNYGRVYISPGASLGKTLLSDPIPSISFTWGYVLDGSPEAATPEEVNNLLSEWGRSHGVCGQILPCLNYTTNIDNTVQAIEWGFGIPS